jgi:hypothetical protein
MIAQLAGTKLSLNSYEIVPANAEMTQHKVNCGNTWVHHCPGLKAAWGKGSSIYVYINKGIYLLCYLLSYLDDL